MPTATVPDPDASSVASAPAAVPDAVASSIEAELERLFIRQAGGIPIVLVTFFPILVFVARKEVPYPQLGLWMALIAITLVARWLLSRRFAAREFDAAGLRARARVLAAIWAASGLVAGAASIFWFPMLEVFERSIFSVAYFAWYATVVVVALVSPAFAFAFGACVLGPLAIAWVMHGGEGGAMVSIVCLLMLVFVRAAAGGAHSAMHEAIRLKLSQAELTRRLERHSEDIEAAMRAKSQFLAAASHDLRQPVTSMNLLLSALNASRDERAMRSVAAKLEAPLQALEEILSSLLEVSRLEAGIINVDKYSAGLRDIVGAVFDEYRPRALAKHLRLEASVGDLQAWTDPELLRRVLRNLIDNAIKFTDDGRVSIEAWADGTTLVIAVSDTGKGVPAAIQERVFDDYFQGENPQRDRRQGLGLGLSIVRRLVELLGGSVRIVPGWRPGARFEVTLPDAIDVRRAVAHEAAPSRPRAHLGVSRVLVVEDDRLVTEAVATLFKTLSLETRFARDGEEAMGQIALGRFQPELAMVDFGLPGDIDGIALIQELRGRLPKCAFLLITGDTRPEVIRRAADEGVTVVHKPLSIDKLDAALKSIGLTT